MSEMITIPKAEYDSWIQRIHEQARQLTFMQESLKDRNKQLDAAHYVWCSGGCKFGIHRFCGGGDTVEPEVVEEAIRQVTRLLTKWRGLQYRAGKHEQIGLSWYKGRLELLRAEVERYEQIVKEHDGQDSTST